jgi:NADH dehydrogenase
MTPSVVIIGAGFAGMWSALAAARARSRAGLADSALDITVVAPEPFLHVRPRLYEPDPGSMRAPLAGLFEAVGVRFIAGTVERIDATGHEVALIDPTGGRSSRRYDRLVLAAGSRLNLPPIPGLREHAFSVDQTKDAVALEAHIAGLGALPASAARDTAIVVGAGFTGIETATEMPGRLRAALGQNTQVKVLVIERADALGPELGPGPRPVITEALTSLGISWRLGTAVTAIDADGVTTDAGDRIAAKTVIWTAGPRASALTEQIPGTRDPLGRLHVDRNLRVIGAPEIFASGDVAFAATDDAGNHAMMSCQHAMNLGRSAGHNVAADLLGLPAIPYSQPKYVTCLDLGPWGAVYTEGWEREVKDSGARVKQLKHQINSEWIYPPPADRMLAFEAADPLRIVVA